MVSVNLLYKKDSFLYKQEMFKHFPFTQIIDYNNIISKLMKKDNLKVRPKEEIVSLEIFNELDKIFSKKVDNNLILYIIKNLKVDVIDSIKSVLSILSERYNKEFELCLSVDDPKILDNKEIRNRIAIFLYNYDKKEEIKGN